ncbi:MAG: UDP-N-acetylglucosamine 2-epimerase (non-hydrolyzing) [Candidatus Eisenbacteria bacterium]|nr:UDP-N-acetylglucosamine 2-epimerase (non-hydrolyzing) [Candidatus Eisenbacteria bacterium]
MRIVLIAGARPNFVKLAPVRRALVDRDDVEVTVVHTGQHYDDAMSASFFRDLEIPEPEVNLGVGSASHAVQTARIMSAFDGFLDEETVDLVVVVGDVNSTLACSVTATKRDIPVAHVEAGLRSFDWAMPEEINRVVTDAVSALLLTPSRDADENLRREGRTDDAIFFVGNVMVDSLDRFIGKARSTTDVLSRLGVEKGGFALLTLHRPRNVDTAALLSGFLGAVERIAERVPVVYPAHPRTRRMLEDLGLLERARSMRGLMLTEPQGYLDFIALESWARLVLTDSGGVQEETTVLGVPCLTLRPNTERPVTVSEGTNRLVGTDPEAIVAAAHEALEDRDAAPKRPELWDGRAAGRVADVLTSWHRKAT